jgi:hypothetical protein
VLRSPLGCAIVAAPLRARAPRLGELGDALALGAWLAAACDALENAALWRALADAPSETRAQVAFIAATIKLALILAGITYALVAGAVTLFFVRARD